jgi:hypothetical protein
MTGGKNRRLIWRAEDVDGLGFDNSAAEGEPIDFGLVAQKLANRTVAPWCAARSRPTVTAGSSDLCTDSGEIK